MTFSPTRRHPFEAPIYTRPDQYYRYDCFMFPFVINLSSFLLFIGILMYISFRYYQHSAPNHKNYLHREKTTQFLTRPHFLDPGPDHPPNQAKYGPMTWIVLGLHGLDPRQSGTPRSSLLSCVLILHDLCWFQTNLPLAALPLWWWYLFNCASVTCRRGMTKWQAASSQ